MNDLQTKVLSYVPAMVGVLLVGAFVLLNNPHSIKNRLFFALDSFIMLWLGFLFIADTAQSNSLALHTLRYGLFFGQIVFPFFYLFALEFPFTSRFKLSQKIFWLAPTIIIAILLLTPLGVKTVSVQHYGVQPELIGFAYVPSDFVGLAYLVAGAWILFRKLRIADAQQKRQIKVVLSAVGLVTVANIYSGLIVTLTHVDSNEIWIGSFSIFVFSLLIAYSMIRHKFFDIRPIVAKAFVYAALIFTLGGIYALVVYGLVDVLLGGDKGQLVVRATYLAGAIVMAFSFQSIRKFFDKFANRIFYRDAYDPDVFLDRFNKLLVGHLQLDKLVESSVEILEDMLKAETVVFYLNETTHAPRYTNAAPKSLAALSSIGTIQTMTSRLGQRIILTDNISPDIPAGLVTLLRRSNVGMLIVLSGESGKKAEELGYVFLGYKKSGNLYTAQDIRILETVANELVLAIQNALRFEEIRRFNETLQEKVVQATKKLSETNQRLKKLDETKDEFISMASHQLRTPLTSVKGYLSMVLEGDAGNLNKNQRKLLEQSFVSSQRMVYLISDLLNLSRLNTGRFVIEATPIDLSAVIQDEVNQLAETAKSRELKLVYNRPEHFPVLMLDENKIHQVVMNFLDNAIYYTPSGGTVTVDLHETPTAVIYTVKDTGIGVPRSVQHKLFTKFYRAQNAQQARPDGTGLGLFMAKKVVAAQGGSLIFDSVEGKGSTFGFRFSKSRVRVPNDKDSVDGTAKPVRSGVIVK